ncbi:MAG: hypothetical protein R6V58_11355, partial [Planctomycetota bacterium]
LGFFRRGGRCVVGRIGRVRASWDRHRGGLCTLRATRGGVRLRLASRVRLRKDGRELVVRQEADPDPRLVVCEEGPERIWMRAMYSLVEGDGTYHGDGLTDAIIYADGEVRLAFGLRLVDSTAHDTLTDAWIAAETDDAVESVHVGTQRGRTFSAADLATPARYRFGRSLPGRSVTLARANGAAAFCWYGDDGAPSDALGGAGLWHGPKPQPPYYETWGHLYGQWKGLSGWAEHEAGRLALDASDGVSVAWHWLHEAEETPGESFGMRAMLGLFLGATPDELAERVEAFRKPLVPGVEGARFHCLDVTENALLYRKTGREAVFSFPRDRLERRVRLRVFGLDGTRATVVEANGRRLAVQRLSWAGITDDPYGPCLARPGDRFDPVIGDLSRGPEHAAFSVELSGRRKTELVLREEPGISLAYAKWDDRRRYVLRSTAHGDRPLAGFSSRTLCLHELHKPGSPAPALHRIPFYWYPTNVQTRGECFNELRRLRLRQNGPGRVALDVESADPNGRARSSARLEVTASEHAATVRTTLRLAVRRPLDLPGIQYLNSFPANSWQPGDWPDDWIIALSADGGRMHKLFKEPREQQEQWTHFSRWRDRMALVQGSAGRGNILILAESVAPPGQPNGYMLCPVWLDSHFTVENDDTPVAPGTVFEAAHTIAVFGDSGLNRTDAAELAERVLDEGTVSLD